jgi:hypothetical protein
MTWAEVGDDVAVSGWTGGSGVAGARAQQDIVALTMKRQSLKVIGMFILTLLGSNSG